VCLDHCLVGVTYSIGHVPYPASILGLDGCSLCALPWAPQIIGLLTAMQKRLLKKMRPGTNHAIDEEEKGNSESALHALRTKNALNAFSGLEEFRQCARVAKRRQTLRSSVMVVLEVTSPTATHRRETWAVLLHAAPGHVAIFRGVCRSRRRKTHRGGWEY